MSFFSRDISSSNSAPLTSHTQQLPSPFGSQTRSPQLQQQSQPGRPWSEHRLNLLPPTFLSENGPPSGLSPSPFPRYGHTLSATATAAGELFLFGGVAHQSSRNDVYVFSTRDLSATLLQTSGDAPSPRFGHAGARIGDYLLIWGGATNTGDLDMFNGPHDDSLYLLNLKSRVWTRIVVSGPGPIGRYHHAVTVVGSKLIVFGGYIDGKVLNDMWAFDLKSLESNPVWDLYDSAPGDEKPPPRAGHVLVTIGDRIILLGGALGRYFYNDTWLFDVSTRKWSELQCIGFTPSPRQGHAATLVDDVIYVFGGCGIDGDRLDDLTSFKLSTQQWSMFQNMGPGPSGRWGHAMASDGARVFVLGGISAIARGGENHETARIHVLDTKHIPYPNPGPNGVEPSETTTQLTQKSSSGPPTQEQSQHSTSSVSDAYAARDASPFQNATPEELGRFASLLTHERIPVPHSLPSQPTGVNGQPRRVPEEDVQFLPQKRHMSTTLAVQTEQDQRVAQLIDELALKSALLEQAEAKALEASKRTELELRERTDRLLAQTSLIELRDAELVKMQAKLDELMLPRDQQVRALQLQVGQYETELADVRAELEARKSELEAVRLRLTDAENGWARSKREADTLRDMTTAGPVSTDEDRITRGLVERIRAMESEMASLRLSEKSLEGMQTRNEG